MSSPSITVTDISLIYPSPGKEVLVATVKGCVSSYSDAVDAAASGERLRDNKIRSIDRKTLVYLVKSVLKKDDNRRCVVVDITDFPVIRVAVRGQPIAGSVIRDSYDALDEENNEVIVVTQNTALEHIQTQTVHM